MALIPHQVILNAASDSGIQESRSASKKKAPRMHGMMPNVWYGAIPSLSVLRGHPSFVCLPERDDVTLEYGRASYRYIKEDDVLWSRLHAGRLTTGNLNAALGFYEPCAGKVLRLHKSWLSHSRIVSVYHHLCDDVYDIGAAKGAEGDAHGRMRNEQAHVLANQQGLRHGNDTDEEAFEALKLRKARSLKSMRDMNKVRCAWGSAQEATTLAILCEHWRTDKMLFEVGLFALNDDEIRLRGFSPDDLPPIGATPDALCMDTCDKSVAVSTFGSFLDACAVVEVKNSCPFTFSCSSRGKCAFHVRDRGPREYVDVLHVPQLQFQMLCSNTPSAFLVSKSASKGMRIFQMERDDEYIQCMLTVLRSFYKTYVVKKRVPPVNALSNLKEHQELLMRTRAIARACLLVDVIDDQEGLLQNIVHSKTIDKRYFLDS
jgi:hypothetical protein